MNAYDIFVSFFGAIQNDIHLIETELLQIINCIRDAFIILELGQNQTQLKFISVMSSDDELISFLISFQSMGTKTAATRKMIKIFIYFI